MSEGELGPSRSGSITIDQLLALNEEIAALVRAGVPLERGLLVACARPAGRLGKIDQRPGSPPEPRRGPGRGPGG